MLLTLAVTLDGPIYGTCRREPSLLRDLSGNEHTLDVQQFFIEDVQQFFIEDVEKVVPNLSK